MGSFHDPTGSSVCLVAVLEDYRASADQPTDELVEVITAGLAELCRVSSMTRLGVPRVLGLILKRKGTLKGALAGRCVVLCVIPSASQRSAEARAPRELLCCCCCY